jgi:hypothetical protein
MSDGEIGGLVERKGIINLANAIHIPQMNLFAIRSVNHICGLLL